MASGRPRKGARYSTAVILIALGVTMGTSAEAAPAGLPSETSPNSALAAVTCPGPTSCLAVGDYGQSEFLYQMLAEHWNGAKWTLQSSPPLDGSFLYGVSCPSTSVCWAVGSQLTPEDDTEALAERWNGSRWMDGTPVSPGTDNELGSVYCVSTLDCFMVGDYSVEPGVLEPLIERYAVVTHTGVVWETMVNPTPAGSTRTHLQSIACVGVNDCNAVGFFYNSKGVSVTLADHWNGSSWRLVPTANPKGVAGSFLYGLACTSTTRCFAVGYSEHSSVSYSTLVEKWNGKYWSLVKSPNRSGVSSSFLNSIACSGSSSCNAVGYSTSAAGEVAFAERWNGSAWSVESTRSPGTGGQLTGVECRSAASCTAVGTDVNHAGVNVSLAEHWNGSTWSVEATPNG